jgi:hypothetical protein
VKIANPSQDSSASKRAFDTLQSSDRPEINDTQLNEKVIEALMKYYAIEEKKEIWHYLSNRTDLKAVNSKSTG